VHTFRAVKAQMSSPAKHAVPDLGCVDIRNASRSLVCHQVPLSLMHWHSVPKAEPFQVPPVVGCTVGSCNVHMRLPIV
jgi:hypothetical protein